MMTAKKDVDLHARSASLWSMIEHLSKVLDEVSVFGPVTLHLQDGRDQHPKREENSRRGQMSRDLLQAAATADLLSAEFTALYWQLKGYDDPREP